MATTTDKYVLDAKMNARQAIGASFNLRSALIKLGIQAGVTYLAFKTLKAGINLVEQSLQDASQVEIWRISFETMLGSVELAKEALTAATAHSFANGKLRKWIGEPTMSFNPCDYGDPYKKRTLLWGNFNTNLNKNPVEPIIPSPLHQNLGGKSEKTKELRSMTPQGFANAFFQANQ